jgi:drug/metabolite transporter (DMT)-like permease
MYLFLPLLSSLLYVVEALFLKQATGHRIGVWRTTFICNWLTAFLFLGLWPLGGTIPDGFLFWQPAVVALLFVAGQIFTFMALEQGDVSVATPVMGTKVILVALFMTMIIPETVPVKLWVAASLSFLGVVFLNRQGKGGRHPHLTTTIGFAMKATVAYALFDVLVMKWAPQWGLGRFLPIMMGMAGLYSLIFIPMFRKPLREISRPAWKILLLGAFFIGMQAIILISTLAVFGDGTSVHVVYSTRGVWSVLAVWGVGSWFGNSERLLGAEMMRWRLLGAGLICAAVVLVFL